LFDPTEVNSWQKADSENAGEKAGSDTGGWAKGAEGDTKAASPLVAQNDALVKEVHPEGALDFKGYSKMLELVQWPTA